MSCSAPVSHRRCGGGWIWVDLGQPGRAGRPDRRDSGRVAASVTGRTHHPAWPCRTPGSAAPRLPGPSGDDRRAARPRNVHLDHGRLSFSAGWGAVLPTTTTRLPAARTTRSDSCSATTQVSWRGSRTGSRKPLDVTVAPPGCRHSAYTTCATSWPPRCSKRASRSWSSHAGLIIVAYRPRWTATVTSFPAATPRPQPPLRTIIDTAR